MKAYEYLQMFGLPVITAVIGWFSSKVQTSREKKQSDLELINKAIAPLLNSIAELTAHVGTVTADLVAEKQKNIALTNERNALKSEINSLTSKITSLEKKVGTLTRLIKASQNEKDAFTVNDM